MSTEAIDQPAGGAGPGGSGEPGGSPGRPDHAVVGIGVAAVAAVVLWAWLGKDSFDSASSTGLS